MVEATERHHKHERKVLPMTKAEMMTKMERFDGIGVEVERTDNDSPLFYFYENFSDDDKGIDRAIDTFMNHPYVKSFKIYPNPKDVEKRRNLWESRKGGDR